MTTSPSFCRHSSVFFCFPSRTHEASSSFFFPHFCFSQTEAFGHSASPCLVGGGCVCLVWGWEYVPIVPLPPCPLLPIVTTSSPMQFLAGKSRLSFFFCFFWVLTLVQYRSPPLVRPCFTVIYYKYLLPPPLLRCFLRKSSFFFLCNAFPFQVFKFPHFHVFFFFSLTRSRSWPTSVGYPSFFESFFLLLFFGSSDYV